MLALVNVYNFYSLNRKEGTKLYPFSENELKQKQSFVHNSIWLRYNIYITTTIND